MCFVCNDPATTAIYTYGPTLSLHDALPSFWAGRGSVMADSRGEPTMEEILASIPRIIADDPAPAGRLAPRKTGGRNSDATDSEPASGVASSPAGAYAAGTANFEAHFATAPSKIQITLVLEETSYPGVTRW